MCDYVKRNYMLVTLRGQRVKKSPNFSLPDKSNREKQLICPTKWLIGETKLFPLQL